MGPDLDCLRYFPNLEELRISAYGLRNYNGLVHVPNLRSLVNIWSDPRYLHIDFANLRHLRQLRTSFSKHLRNLETLEHLTELHLDHVTGMSHLDFSALSKLETLHIGPAGGVKTVSLAGLRCITALALISMRSLLAISGEEFYRTVKKLDLRGTPKIPRAIAARFTQLEHVEVSPNSTITSRDFLLCSPRLSHMPM